MKRKNRKTVETRLSFAAAFSSPHPFVAFVLSESLGTRLGFTEKNIEEHIQLACGDKPELVEDFQS